MHWPGRLLGQLPFDAIIGTRFTDFGSKEKNMKRRLQRCSGVSLIAILTTPHLLLQVY